MSQIKGSRELVCAKYFIERQKLSCLFWHIVMSYIVNVETVANGLLIPGSNSCLSTAIKVMKGHKAFLCTLMEPTFSLGWNGA